jgi:hypothetical protein
MKTLITKKLEKLLKKEFNNRNRRINWNKRKGIKRTSKIYRRIKMLKTKFKGKY